MITFKQILNERRHYYKSVLSNRAHDIGFDSIEDLCYSLGYILKNISRLDAEIPEHNYSSTPNYKIKDGITTGGFEMKMGPQYRIYLKTIKNIPSSLLTHLQNDNKKRITGSLFIEACIHVGFKHGRTQNNELIISKLKEIFSEDELKNFYDGYNS